MGRLVDVWSARPDRGYVEVFVESSGDIEALNAFGLPYFYDEPKTQEFLAAQAVLSGDGLSRAIPGFSCYRTVEETYATMDSLVANYPALAERIDIGDTWEKLNLTNAGYDLFVLKLTNQAIAGDKPILYAMGSIHARELAPAELVTRFAETLLSGYGVDANATWILDHHEVHLVLQGNPDGRKQAETGDLWRKTTNQDYCGPTSSSRGADMNRNFPFQWGGIGASTSQCNDTFRGSGPQSEPETSSIVSYVQSIFADNRGPALSDPAPLDTPGVYIDVHSFGELVLWPYGFDEPSVAPNATELRRLGQRFAWFNGYTPQQSSDLYPAAGASDDFAYGDLGVAAYTFELGTSFFQGCSTFESQIVPDNLAALMYAARVARAPYQLPSGPDSEVIATPALVEAGEIVTLEGVVSDNRFGGSGQTIQNIASANVYVDTPPWEMGATPVPATAVDGTYNSSTESVTATVDTTGLAAGQYIAYLQGADSGGATGPVGATFFEVVDDAWTLSGTVTDAMSQVGIPATVEIGGLTLNTDANGNFEQRLAAGVIDVTVSATGYDPKSMQVDGSGGNDLAVGFSLNPLCQVFTDDVETPGLGWSTTGAWARTTETASSPVFSWTDSPGGVYSNNSNTSLTSPTLDLSTAQAATLSFNHLCDTEATYDFGFVEVSTGGDWSQVFSCDGQTSWESEFIDLPSLAGEGSVQFRFRLQTDSFVTDDGWHVDDVVVAASCAVAGPPQIQISGCSADEDGANCEFGLSLSSPATEEITVDYATADGSAEAGSDYAATSGTATFMTGESLQTIAVAVTDDALDEFAETFTVTLNNPIGATLGATQATGTINDDDPEPSVSASGCEITPQAGLTTECIVTVQLSQASEKSISLDYATADGGASSPSNYLATSGTVSFNPGDVSQEISVDVAAQDPSEDALNFYIEFSNAVNATPPASSVENLLLGAAFFADGFESP